MDFIERIFHLAPDGGTGLLEWTILFVSLLASLATLRLRARKTDLLFWARSRPSMISDERD